MINDTDYQDRMGVANAAYLNNVDRLYVPYTDYSEQIAELEAENKRLREDAAELAETLYAASAAVRYLLPHTRAKVIDVHNRVGKRYISFFEEL